MKNITEEMRLEKEWYKQAESVELKDLENFVRGLIEDYNHDYGTIVKAMCAGMKATFSAMNNDKNQGGITGFQAGCLSWEIFKQFRLEKMVTGARLLNFDHMLYPQYEDRFDKVIDAETWNALQKQAKENIEKKEVVTEQVLLHWHTIANGLVPFGYKVKQEET